MNHQPGPDAPAHYELRIEGHLDEHWSAWFGGLTLIPEDDGTTTLRGPVTDQAELHGLLAKVRDLGTALISVKTIDAPASAVSGPASSSTRAPKSSPPPMRAARPPSRSEPTSSEGDMNNAVHPFNQSIRPRCIGSATS